MGAFRAADARISKYDAIIFIQHGGVNGPVNQQIAGLLSNSLAPALGDRLNGSGFIVLQQCRAVFSPTFVGKIKAAFDGATLYSAKGWNHMSYFGITSDEPLFPESDLLYTTGRTLNWDAR